MKVLRRSERSDEIGRIAGHSEVIWSEPVNSRKSGVANQGLLFALPGQGLLRSAPFRFANPYWVVMGKGVGAGSAATFGHVRFPVFRNRANPLTAGTTISGVPSRL